MKDPDSGSEGAVQSRDQTIATNEEEGGKVGQDLIITGSSQSSKVSASFEKSSGPREAITLPDRRPTRKTNLGQRGENQVLLGLGKPHAFEQLKGVNNPALEYDEEQGQFRRGKRSVTSYLGKIREHAVRNTYSSRSQNFWDKKNENTRKSEREDQNDIESLSSSQEKLPENHDPEDLAPANIASSQEKFGDRKAISSPVYNNLYSFSDAEPLASNYWTDRLRTFTFQAIDFCDRFWERIMLESTWLLLFVVGVLSSVLAWALDEFVQVLLYSKEQLAHFAKESLYTKLLFAVFSIFLAISAVYTTRSVGPLAAGSGIPQMKSILAGFSIPGYLSIRTLIAKIFGLVFALASGVVIGTEGPFVHLSCIIASQMLHLPGFNEVRESPTLTRQILAAACAVGVSSCFGSPIGGVLFSIEVTSSYYHVDDYWKGFFCAVCGAFTFKELSYFGTSRNNIISLFTTDFEPLPYAFAELPFFVVLSLICGYIGGLYVKFYNFVSRTIRESDSILLANDYCLAIVVSTLTLVANFSLGEFMLMPLRNVVDDLFISGNMANEARHAGNWDEPSVFFNLFLFAVLKFALSVLGNMLRIPCGIFTPVFVVGATFGRLFGEIMHLVVDSTLPAGYSLVGAAAFTAGVTGTVSPAVIIFELTNQLSYMLPVLLAVLLGRSSAYVNVFLYESMGKSRNLPTFPRITRQSSYETPITKLMRSGPCNVQCVPRYASRRDIENILAETSFDSEATDFAIVDSLESRFYLGSVTSTQLIALLDNSELVWESSLGDTVKVDLTEVCSMDESVPSLRDNTTLSELLRLAYASIYAKSYFVTDNGRVIGKVVTADLVQKCNNGII